MCLLLTTGLSVVDLRFFVNEHVACMKLEREKECVCVGGGGGGWRTHTYMQGYAHLLSC
jgi:hypothetical protein